MNTRRMDTRNKILGADELARRIVVHRKKGESVVLTNGCFDILHAGHARYLEGARAEGDVLVVAINSDAGVRKLKGEGRPVMPAAARAELVAAMAAVDYVVIFDEPDVESLLRHLRPDVHAKGSDYTTETVPERKVARQLGIRVAIVGGPKSYSTRDVLARMGGKPGV
jgi:rfaE bifunctional protein nucleotidyltransferase chain/domain